MDTDAHGPNNHNILGYSVTNTLGYLWSWHEGTYRATAVRAVRFRAEGLTLAGGEMLQNIAKGPPCFGRSISLPGVK